MKQFSHFSRRLLCCALALLLALPSFPALAGQAMQYSARTELARGLSVTQTNSRSASGSYRQSFALDYLPGGAAVPKVFYGTYLYGKSPILTVTNYAKNQGYHVLAAVNADFFSMTTGIPTGMTVQNGRLVSSDGAWNAVGFFADGTAIVGAPKLTVTLTLPDGTVKPVYALNNVRTADGIYLYTRDFSSNTATTAAGREVVLEMISDDALRLGQPMTAVVSANEHRSATPIGAHQMVLSLTDSNTAGLTLDDLPIGTVVTLSAQTADPRWSEVIWGCGGGNMLVKEGQLTAQATAEVAPRTILGVKETGELRILEVDGRQSALSAGISLREAAQTLLDAGYTTVINLDGGGSSAFAASMPGKATALLSSPSEGSPRACATYIVFVSKEDGRSAQPFGGVIYPRSATVLTGASLEISAFTYSENAMDTTDRTDFIAAQQGDTANGIYYAPALPCTDVLSLPGISGGNAEITVTDQVESLAVTLNGKKITTLSLDRGKTAQLQVSAYDGLRQIICQNEQFTFTVSGGVGAISGEGLFLATDHSAKGAITVSYGEKSVTIPVTVAGKPATLLEGFEENTLTFYGDATAASALETAADAVRYGHASAKLTYSGMQNQVGEWLFSQPLMLDDATHLSLFAKGESPLQVLFRTDSETEPFCAVPLTVQSADWAMVTLEIPENAVSLLGFARKGAGKDTVWLDQLCTHYGAIEADLQAPKVQAAVSGGRLTATVSDNIAVATEQIRVTVDGKSQNYTVTGGKLTAAVPADGSLHRVTVTVSDLQGNLARASVDYGAIEKSVFTDLKGHWAAPYAEYLREKGVFSENKQFEPTTKVSNAMAAVMLSRYLGVDVTQYESLRLPYTDANKIPAWALPHVKAMYALGMMKGGVDSKGRAVLNPDANCSRAQIMTILGRTLERGYECPACTYADASAIPAWARNHVDVLSALGIVTGSNNRVNPTGTITRAEFAALLYRMD